MLSGKGPSQAHLAIFVAGGLLEAVSYVLLLVAVFEEIGVRRGSGARLTRASPTVQARRSRHQSK